ncbi:hypothetical protein FDX20_27955, partial [Citrobacter sp. TBCS-11]
RRSAPERRPPDTSRSCTIVPAAILLATAGLVLTTLVRMLSVVLVHQADRAAENGLEPVGVQVAIYSAMIS